MIILLISLTICQASSDQAGQYLRESAAAAEPGKRDRYNRGQLATLILATRGLDRRTEVEQQLLEALSLASSGRGFWSQTIALIGAALLCVNVGEVERAV